MSMGDEAHLQGDGAALFVLHLLQRLRFMTDGKQHLHVARPDTDMRQDIRSIRGEHCYCTLRDFFLSSHTLSYQNCWLIIHLGHHVSFSNSMTAASQTCQLLKAHKSL